MSYAGGRDERVAVGKVILEFLWGDLSRVRKGEKEMVVKEPRERNAIR